MPDARLFVAVTFPESFCRRLSEVLHTLKRIAGGSRLRWAGEKSVHVTLKFLGSVEESRIEEIVRSLEGNVTGFDSFDVAFGGIGSFGSESRPRVFWLGIRVGEKEIRELAATVGRALVPLGFPLVAREFSPHVTLARVRKEASRADYDALRALKENAGAISFEPIEVNRVTLLRSYLSEAGSRYETVAQIESRA